MHTKLELSYFFPNGLLIVSLHNASLRNTFSLRHALFDVTLAAAAFFFGMEYVSQSFYFHLPNTCQDFN